MNIVFQKYQGTGNDFIIIDNREKQYDRLTSNHIQFLCDRHFGIGADGLMLFNNADSYDFEMKYYNADGNESTMCGNGGRCIVQFAYTHNIISKKTHFLAIDGEHEAIIENENWVKLKMKDVSDVIKKNNDCIIDTGSPHYIKQVQHINDINVVDEGRKIRYSEAFKENGINVNFVEIKDNKNIFVRTYERGVENETLSCGTGVVASALISAHTIGVNQINIETLGGNLTVEYNKIDNTHFKEIWLCGPATMVFAGSIKINNIS